jgi:DNA-binding PadR family transcriptional regulator
MLELAILGLLKEQPMHGYDLRKRLRSGAGLLASLSYGSLYPALARLEQQGAVREVDPAVVEEPAAPVMPLTGSLSGERAAWRARLAARAAGRSRSQGRPPGGTRGRKVYELTAIGDEMFSSLLADEAGRQGDDRTFNLRWSFARYLPSEGRLVLLERQRRRLEDRIAAARRGLDHTGSGLDRFQRQIAEHALDSLGTDLSWVESLIATERAVAGSPPGAAPPAGAGSIIAKPETDVSRT